MSIQLNSGAGGLILAADTISGEEFQEVKVQFGADGTRTPVSRANPLPVAIDDPLSPFGEALTVEPVPMVQVSFQYAILAEQIDTTTLNGAGATSTNSVALLNTSTNVAGASQVETKDIVSYRPGQGVAARLTGYFETPAASSTQYLGAIDDINGFAFGYNGTTFGILHRDNSSDDWSHTQATWNVDPMDGTGPSGMTLDPQTGNVYAIVFPWLGFGSISFFIHNPVLGNWQLVHRIQAANAQVTPSVRLPKFPLRARIENAGNATDLTMGVICLTAFNLGPVRHLGPKHADGVGLAGVGSATVEHLLTIRNKTTFQGLTNRVPLLLESISVGSDGAKPGALSLLKGATFSAGPTYADYDTANSVVERATDVADLTLGQRLPSFAVQGSFVENLRPYDIRLQPGEALSFGYQQLSGNADVQLSVSWIEDF